MNNEIQRLCTEPTVNIETLISDTPPEDFETLELPPELTKEEADALFLFEEEYDGYFNGCDLAFPPLPPMPPLFNYDDLEDLLTDDKEDATPQEEVKKTWCDKIMDKLDAVDWEEVYENINTAAYGIGQILGYFITFLVKFIISIVFISTLGEMASEVRQQIPTLYHIIDVLIEFSERFLSVCFSRFF